MIKENIEQSYSGQILSLAQDQGILSAMDLASQGIPRVVLSRLVKKGELEHISRGLYQLPNAEITENHFLAQLCKRAPKGVICLLSALRFHDLTTQSPSQVWMMIPKHDRAPRIDYPPLRVVRAADTYLNFGIEEHVIESVNVKVTTPARTVADCFKFRNKIGIDVAIEALRDFFRYRKERGYDLDDLRKAAKVCRVSNVMSPYLMMMFE